MSTKRKTLLYSTIIFIACCYGIAFYFILNSNDSSPDTNDFDSEQIKHSKVEEKSEESQSKFIGISVDHPDSAQINISQFKGNQLQNGATPFDYCFGKGEYSGNATLTVKNGSNSDAIICLYSTTKNRTIRNNYIKKNNSFTLSSIAQDRYKIRVFYGNDWNPTIKNPCGTAGYFESDISFSEFDKSEYFEDNESGHTAATITLYVVSGGNASTSTINKSEFFNK